MATYDFTGRTLYSVSDGSFLLSDGNAGSATDQQPDPSQPGALEFNLAEDIFVNGSSGSVDFIGYYTGPGGVLYPVFQGVAFYEVLGIELDPSTTFASLNITAANFTVCFAPGTMIATPTGERRVESLAIGELILTSAGEATPVKWIGQQTVVGFFAKDRARPVRVAAGALGNGLPYADLVLTADHALIFDGLAVNAGALVNGWTITFDPVPDRVTYFHIETPAHETILANGAAAESYVDYIGRQAFDNYADYLSL